jgi:GGDEF domain-containing protein
LTDALQLFEKIRSLIESYDFGNEVQSRKITVSIGVVTSQDVKEDRILETDLTEVLVKFADLALYKAKEQKNRVVSYQEFVSSLKYSI